MGRNRCSHKEPFTGGLLPCCRHRTSGRRHLRLRGGSRCRRHHPKSCAARYSCRRHRPNSCAARCSCRRQRWAAPGPPEAQSPKTAARWIAERYSWGCHHTPTEAANTPAEEHRWMNPDCRIPSNRDCSAARPGCAAPTGCRPARRTAASRRGSVARARSLTRGPVTAACSASWGRCRFSARALPAPRQERQPSNDWPWQRPTARMRVAVRRTAPAPRGWSADG
jgi:hypothetical protein